MNTVTVKINGMEYNLKGKEDDEYLLKVSEYVDGKFKEVSSNNNKLSISSVAVLSALNIADELFKCNKEVDDLLKKKDDLEERNKALEEINQVLDEKNQALEERNQILEERNQPLEERNLALKERMRQIKKEAEEIIKNKNQEIASLKEMLYLMEQKSREAEILNDKVADLTEELEEKSRLEEEVASLKEEMAALQNKNEDLVKKVEVLESNLSSSDENNKKLSMSLLNTQDEFLKEKKENEKLNSKILELNEEIANKVSLEEYNNVLDKHSVLQESIEQISIEKSEIENMLEEFKINIKDIKLENKNLKDSEDALKQAILLKDDQIEEYKSKSSVDEEEAKILKDRILELEATITKGKEQRKALLNRDKDIKFQLQNFKYKVLDLEKKLIDVQIELAAERRKANPLLK